MHNRWTAQSDVLGERLRHVGQYIRAIRKGALVTDEPASPRIGIREPYRPWLVGNRLCRVRNVLIVCRACRRRKRETKIRGQIERAWFRTASRRACAGP